MKINSELIQKDLDDFIRKLPEEQVWGKFNELLNSTLRREGAVHIKSSEKLFDYLSSLEVSLIEYQDEEMSLDQKSDLSDTINVYLDKAQKSRLGKEEQAEEKSDENKKKKKTKS